MPPKFHDFLWNPVEKIRRIFDDYSKIISIFLKKCCWYSLEAFLTSTSAEEIRCVFDDI